MSFFTIIKEYPIDLGIGIFYWILALSISINIINTEGILAILSHVGAIVLAIIGTKKLSYVYYDIQRNRQSDYQQ